MATSGNIDKVLASWLTMRINWVVNSQDIAKNSSNVTVKVQLITGNGEITASAAKAIKVSINGTTYSSTTTITVGKNNTGKTIYTKTVDVPHNSDGTKKLALNCTLTFDATISGSWWDDKYSSGTATLNTIARASTFTRSGTAAIGSEQTITITKKNSSFTHTLKYTWGGATTTIVTKTTAASYKWTPAASLATKIPSATSGTCVLTCETYNGDTLIGSATLSFTLSVPDTADFKPTVSKFTLTEAVAGLANTFIYYVDKQSKINFSVAAAGAQGSTIKSYSVSIAGQTFTSATGTGTTKALNLGLTEATNPDGKLYSATVTVTDSRGRTAIGTAPFKVYPYTPPTITNFSAARCNSDKTLNDEGTFLLLKYTAKVASVNGKNDGYLSAYFKETTATAYESIADNEYFGTEIDGSNGALINNAIFSTEKAYHIKLAVSDHFTTIESIYEVSTAKPMLDLKKNKKGVGIGSVATEDDLLDVGYRIRFYGGILQRVLEKSIDFNNVMTPNTYTLKNASSANYVNCPILTGTGILKVEACGEDGQIRQVVTVCSKTNPLEYERFYYEGTWGAWKRNFEVVLYNEGAAAGAITLTESAANFKYIEIFFTDNNNKNGGYAKVYSPNGKTLSLSIVEAGDATNTYIRRTQYTISDTSITPVTTGANYVRFNGNLSSSETGGYMRHASSVQNYIRIIRVVGIE